VRSLRAFLAVAWSEASVDWRPLLLALVGVVLGLTSQLYLGRFVDAGSHPQLASSYSAFLIVGLALLEWQSSLVGGLALRVREAQRSGALEAFLATPLSVPSLLVGVAAYDVLFAVLRLVGYLAIGVLIFGVPIASAHWPTVMGAIALSSLAFVGLALLGAGLTLELRRSDPLSMVIGALSIIAGDVLYPSTVLPSFVRAIGAFLPLRPALEALRGGFGGELCSAALLTLVAQAVVLITIGTIGFAWAYQRARRRGTLYAP
jgi:ABC-2 type transport system permease protein